MFPTVAYRFPTGVENRTPYSRPRDWNWTTAKGSVGAAALACSLHYQVPVSVTTHVRPGYSGARRDNRRFASMAMEWCNNA